MHAFRPKALHVQVTGKCGSVLVRLIPAPRGAGIVAARTPKKVLQMAGIDDVYTAATGSTKTLGNFVKVQHQSTPIEAPQVDHLKLSGVLCNGLRCAFATSWEMHHRPAG